MFTNSPFAPVWRMVTAVEVGAVTAANAARTTEKARLRSKTKYSKTKTKAEARVASARAITSTFPPFFFKTERRKNSPMEKATKDKATSDKKSSPSATGAGIRFRQ